MSRKLAFTFLSTLLLFVLTACAPDSLYGNMQVTLAPGEATRVVVVLSASAVKDSLLEFDVLHDAPAARVRIVPDDELLPIVELAGCGKKGARGTLRLGQRRDLRRYARPAVEAGVDVVPRVS